MNESRDLPPFPDRLKRDYDAEEAAKQKRIEQWNQEFRESETFQKGIALWSDIEREGDRNLHAHLNESEFKIIHETCIGHESFRKDEYSNLSEDGYKSGDWVNFDTTRIRSTGRGNIWNHPFYTGLGSLNQTSRDVIPSNIVKIDEPTTDAGFTSSSLSLWRKEWRRGARERVVWSFDLPDHLMDKWRGELHDNPHIVFAAFWHRYGHGFNNDPTVFMPSHYTTVIDAQELLKLTQSDSTLDDDEASFRKGYRQAQILKNTIARGPKGVTLIKPLVPLDLEAIDPDEALSESLLYEKVAETLIGEIKSNAQYYLGEITSPKKTGLRKFFKR